MTEAEWCECSDPRQLLRFLFSDSNHVPARRVRLFAVACCQRVASRLPSEVCRQAIETAEQFARVSPTRESARHWREQLMYHPVAGIAAQAVANGVICAVSFELLPQMISTPEWVNTYRTEFVVNAHWWCAEALYQESVYRDPPEPRRWAKEKSAEERAQSELLRCIFGNPFRPVSFDPTWRTSDVLALARGVYDERAFDRMPILADALQDAGCDNSDILSHCRDTNTPHARGCWVVDLILNQS